MYIWIYAMAALALTALTFGVFFVCILRGRKSHGSEEEEFPV